MLGQMPAFGHGVKIVSYCPLCETQYNVKHAKIIEERDDAQLLHITCSKCQSSVLALILMNPMGISSMGLISDLTSSEVGKFRKEKIIETDEVIDFHRRLEKESLYDIFGFGNISN
jgi:hypothetical protein